MNHRIDKQYLDSQLTKKIAQIGLSEAPVAIAYYQNQKNIQSVPHSHSYCEIILIVEGSDVQYFTDDAEYIVTKGDMIYLPAGHTHSAKFNLTDDNSIRIVIQIDSKMWNNVVERTGIKWFDKTVVLRKGYVEEWDYNGLALRINQTLQAQKDIQKQLFEAQITEMQLLIDQAIGENKKRISGLKNDIVSRAIKYLEENYTNQSVSVESLTDHINISRAHLAKTFKTYTSESVHEYLTRLRMQHFKKLIAEGNSVLEASLDSGFSDYSSFVKAFKRLYGITPRQYRVQLRDEFKK